MSSTISDPTRKTLLDVVTNSISQLQQKQILNKDRFQSIRRIICQSIGLTILLYFIFRIPFLLYALLKVLLQSLVYLLTIIFWPYVKLLEFFLPKTTNYGILFPLFLIVSILSFLTAKLSSRKGYKNSPFLVVFVVLILAQSAFVLRPIALSINEQRKLPLSPSIDKETIPRLSAKTDEHTSTVDQNMSIQMFSSRITADSDVNGKHSNSIREHKTQSRLADETLSADVLSEAKEREISSSQQTNRSPQSAVKRFNRQIKRSNDKLNRWLDEAWHVHKFSNSQWKPHMSHILQRHVSSFYTAYTDLRCTEHARLIARQSSSKNKHFDVLDTYRSQSPFPIYLSILNSNGPKCYRYYSESSCANSPNASSISLTKSFYYLAQLSMFISIVSVIFVFIMRRRQHDNKSKSCRHQPVVSNHVKNLPNEQISVNNELTEKVDKELRQWLERERCIGCRNMSETYRRTLNDRCLAKYDYPQVDSLQFSNVTISNICQACNSSSVVNATLTIHSSVFTLLNSIRHEQYLVEIRRLVGDLEISLINEIQLRFTAKQIGSVELIDSTNVSTADGKQAILKLLIELINQTTVQFTFQQDKISNELPDTRPIATTVQPVELRAAFPVPSITDNHQQIIPPKAKIKKLLIRIVKAVKLHNVEQPFCVLELNHPKQVHQTSIAKNGLNPFWDESFTFDCDEKSNEIHLKIFDRQKPNKKLNTDITDKLYTDVAIPFSYVTSTIYKEDVRITPQYPESIIRIEFSTLTEEDTARVNNGSDFESNIDSQSWSSYRREPSRTEQNHQQTPSTDASPSDPPLGNNFYNYTSSLSRTTTTDIFPTPPDENSPLPKPRKSRSFMNSLRSFASFRHKKNVDKGKLKKNGTISSPNSTTGTNTLPHSFSADPYLYSHATGAESFRRHNTITRSFRNMFRSSSRKLPLQADNFILDHPDLLSTSPTSQKKPSFFQRFRSKRKTRRLNSLANSLTSYDRTRAESVQNTPVRANGTRPVTMTK